MSSKRKKAFDKRLPSLGWADRLETFLGKKGSAVVLGAMVLFVVVFGTLCVRKYLSYGYSDYDLANDVAVYWNSVHGRLFYNPFLQELVIGGHFYAIVLLVLPLFALAPHAITVLLLQTVFLALPAWPLYRLARERTQSSAFAVLLSVLYLIYPCVGYMALWEAHFDVFTIFFFACALLFFERGRFGAFLVALILAVSVKENASFAVFMFGPYAWVRRRSWRWVWAPSALGFFWFLIVMKAVIPFFAKVSEGGYLFSSYYDQFGASIPEIVKNLALHPIAALRFMFAGHKSAYVISLLAPTAGLFILSPAALLMTLPVFAQNMLSKGFTHSQIYFHYTAMMVPFFFAALIEGYRRLMTFGGLLKWRVFVWVFLIGWNLLVGVLLRSPQLFAVWHFGQTRITEEARLRDRLIAGVPPDASVITTFQFSPKLARRLEICTIHFVANGFKMYSNVPYEPPAHLEVAVLDFNDPLMLSSFWPPQAPMNIRNFLERDEWRVADMANDFVIFKKRFPQGKVLVEAAPDARPKVEVNANIDGRLTLIGYDIEPAVSDVGRLIHFTFYWKRTGVSPDLGMAFKIDADGQKKEASTIHMIGYRIYPTSAWPEGEVLAERYALYVSESVPSGEARIKLSVFSAADGQVYPFRVPGRGDAFDILEVGRVVIPALSAREKASS